MGAENIIGFYFRTAEAWDAMYADCEAATRSIHVEQYIFRNDEAGGRFLRLFLEKAKVGVEVKLMLDAVGSRDLHEDQLIADIRRAGGLVHFYHDLGPRRIFFPSRWVPRTHVKTMLIDDAVAYTGGVCFSETMRDWHDLHARFTGPVVKQASEESERIWARMLEGKRILIEHRRQEKDSIRYALSQPSFGTSPIYREIVEKLNGAKQRVRVCTPYFLPPRRLRRALMRATLRGVDVEILMSAKTDVPWADWAARTYFRRLMRSGVKITLHQDSVLHAKYVLVDNDWATVGSVNIDYLSLKKNREASLVITDA
ncbi:MAG: phosphatidylserine/phosphatidylglycerophosphate/cardiolipin synthase family protein, partial [Alphaproteobacteria bacterium]